MHEMKQIFGSLLFDRKKMKEHLPSHVWEKLQEAIEGRGRISASTADIVAAAMKEWALSVGATHWTHWFHPRTEKTAEKHNAFISSDLNGYSFYSFSGRDLIQSEPDASSFPSGGMRSTFEARGYSAWDPSSPAFVVPTPKGGTLCIPSVFLSYDGTPLDLKAPLLKAIEAVESRTMKLLRLLGNRGAKLVRVTVGAEQEFFLIDRTRAQTRPDIRSCGRSLIGAPFPRSQHVEAHYLGSISPRIVAYMEDVERDLAKFGVNIATRHNEAAPCQFEFAPLFAEANIACDQNQIIMETLKKQAIMHNLRLMLHEKPFAGINGSGKHINFSICDEEGNNLLQPSTTFRKNITFLCLMSALMMGLAEYHGLLNASIATPGNMYRLGGSEAPPSIMSLYLGETLTKLFDAIADGKEGELTSGANTLDLGLNKLPSLLAYNCDRNRTSPIAFTGNKFEFRAPGSSQAVSAPLAMMLSIWAWGIGRMVEKIEGLSTDKTIVEPEKVLSILSEVAKESSKVRFEGNAYSNEWRVEARKRGLAVPESIPDAIEFFVEPKYKKMLSEMGIFTEREMDAYREIRLEHFCDILETEIGMLKTLMYEGILPAISKQIVQEGEAFAAAANYAETDMPEWKNKISHLAQIKNLILKSLKKLDDMREGIHAKDDSGERAKIIAKRIVPVMEEIRCLSDEAESLLAKDNIPYLTYRDLLSVS